MLWGHQSHLCGSAGHRSLPQGPGQLPSGLLKSRQSPLPFETTEAVLMVSESPLGSLVLKNGICLQAKSSIVWSHRI